MEFCEWYPLLDEAARAAINIRRELHRWPEPGGEEYKTACLIEKELKNMGLIPRRVLPTGICASIAGRGSVEKGKAIALRADIDGLPIAEQTGLPFSSAREGYMHACGHDVHAAILLGTALILRDIKDKISVNVELIFQPDEENEGGAKKMIEQGILCGGSERPNGIEMIFGLHLMPDLPAGSLGLKYGKVHAASIMFKIKITGARSHGAKPQEGADAITGAAQIVSAAQLIVSRELSPIKSGLITFGKINGGEALNITAGEVTLEGIIRGEDRKTCDFLKDRLEAVTSQMAVAFRLKSESAFKDGYPALINDEAAVNHLKGAIEKYNGHVRNSELESGGACIKIQEIEHHTMTVDDFAYYLEEIPGAFMFLGSGRPGRRGGGLHTGDFDPDESCVKTGIAALTAAVCC